VGPRSQFGCCGEEKNLASAGNKFLAFQPIAHHCTKRDIQIHIKCISAINEHQTMLQKHLKTPCNQNYSEH
jgi:hypothetical protein